LAASIRGNRFLTTSAHAESGPAQRDSSVGQPDPAACIRPRTSLCSRCGRGDTADDGANGNEDSSWDAQWESVAAIDAGDYTVGIEMPYRRSVGFGSVVDIDDEESDPA
jgi:hypothetical protein